MTKFFDEQNDLAELILRILTPEKSLKVLRVTAQREVKNLKGKCLPKSTYLDRLRTKIFRWLEH